VKTRTLLVDAALADGQRQGTKAGRVRAVSLLPPLAADLAEWRMACGRPGDETLVFPTRAGLPWRDHDWRNWRRHVFDAAVADLGLPAMRPYDLRHAFCSLLLHDGRSVIEVAAEAGHAPTMTLDTYGHVIADLKGAPPASAEAMIRAAREAQVSGLCPPASSAADGLTRDVQCPSRRPDSNRGPLHYERILSLFAAQ
jgi:integrase